MAIQNSPNTISCLEKKLDHLECELQTHYIEMSKTLLELVGQEQKTINNLVDEIIALRKRLAGARQESRCGECLTFNPPDAKICKRCGSKLTDSD